MQLETTGIRAGAHIGKVVWICHYHQPDVDKKPLRNVPPTKVIIRSTNDLPSNKTVYYSHTYFSPLSKKDLPLAKVISPVDNTGYRSHVGNELSVFTSENECKTEWNKQLNEVMLLLDKKIENAADEWQQKQFHIMNLMSNFIS